MLKTLITGFMLTACCVAGAETILTVEYLDGQAKQEQLAKVSKIVFDGSENISLDLNDGNTKALGNVSSVQKIVFADGVLTSANQVNATSIKIYPNPTTESISIEGIEDGQQVKIYSVSGKLAQVSNDSVINVASLANGEYIVVVGQTVAKMIKK